MSIHQLSLGTKSTRWDERSIIFIIPRSADPDDFAIISPWSEKQILKRGIPETLEIYGYHPVLEKIEPQIKEFLKGKVADRHSKNFTLRRTVRWSSAFGIIACFFFVFSGFFDDVLFDPFFATVFGYTVYREYEERKLLSQWNRRIDTLRFRESHVLNAIYDNFTQLDSEEYRAIDWHSVITAEKADVLFSLQKALVDFLDYGTASHGILSVNTTEASASGISLSRIFSSLSQKLAFARRIRAKNELKIGSGYYDIYTGFLDSIAELSRD